MKPTSTGIEHRRRILEYLIDGVDSGKHYFKSKHIAQDVGLSPKEVGCNIPILQNEENGVLIEKWGRTKSNTWQVNLT